jgi:hypothetical protein
MAKRASFNLSETIREYRKAHRGVKAMDALEAIKKAHPSQKINDGTFKSTFYKLAGTGKRTVRRRKPGRVIAGHGSRTSLHSACRERRGCARKACWVGKVDRDGQRG